MTGDIENRYSDQEWARVIAEDWQMEERRCGCAECTMIYQDELVSFQEQMNMLDSSLKELVKARSQDYGS